MWIFGADCYAYSHDQKKLDPKCKKEIFVGYSKNSPAYLVYNPQTRQESKHRLLKFIKMNSGDQQTQTDEFEPETNSFSGRKSETEESGSELLQKEDGKVNQILNRNDDNTARMKMYKMTKLQMRKWFRMKTKTA